MVRDVAAAADVVTSVVREAAALLRRVPTTLA